MNLRFHKHPRPTPLNQHRCLSILEIQSSIFEHLYQASDSATLARLARCCHGFTEQATNLLWRSQLTLGPLIQVMPPDLWQIVSVNAWENRVDLLRPIRETDWSRFDHYGRKIHALGQAFPTPPGSRCTSVHRDFLVAFSTYRPCRLLLPSLHRISLDLHEPHDAEFFPFSQIVLGENLSHIFLAFSPSCENASDFFSSISRLCPRVRVIELDHEQSGESMQEFYRLLRSQLSLESIRVSMTEAPPQTAVFHLGELSSLRSWKTVQLPHKPNLNLFTSRGGRFSALREFEFEARTLESATSVIDSMRCPFESLAIDATSAFHTDETYYHRSRWAAPQPLGSLNKLVQSITTHPLITTLVHLEVDAHVSSLPETPFSPNAEQILQPLFLLRRLENVRLAIGALGQLNDTWLRDAAAAWPHLQSLILTEYVTKMTLEGLIPLVRCCPRLNNLLIALIAKPFDPTLLLGSSNMFIRRLMFVRSPIVSPEKVFRCLVLMFPKLNSAKGSGRREDRQNWQKVDQLLRASI
ncbi:hypothetical protein Hypma_012490 [Hypsizygus marmoreus]|uniref:F-box domain-containing protein n=1 Tax=Hypsizygus marmoreus TaxID=39966 RepID=A0A369JF48_HYPMA|nr:hypothetical protein Hypma_012490 [Hypsizygus marmoreus]